MATHLRQRMMLALPALPADLDISYTPEVLLETPFPVSRGSQREFEQACAFGFESYFAELMGLNEGGEEVFVKRGYSWDEVVSFLVENVESSDCFAPVPLVLKVGVCHGWLSALALFDPVEAQRALVVLAMLIHPLRFLRSHSIGKP